MKLLEQYEALLRDKLKSIGCNKELTDTQLNKMKKNNRIDAKDSLEVRVLFLSRFFYSVIYRLVKKKPRAVVKCEGFDEKGHSEGLSRFAEKIIGGESLIPHLSKDVFNIDQVKYNDGMLNEWGIYHFHIPSADGVGSFVERTRDILFAIVTDAEVIFLDIKSHDSWCDAEVFEKIEKHYPQLLTPYFVSGGRNSLSADERKNLRSKNYNSCIITNTGNEYDFTGCGSVASGLPLCSVVRADGDLKFIDELSKKYENSLMSLYFDENCNLECQILDMT